MVSRTILDDAWKANLSAKQRQTRDRNVVGARGSLATNALKCVANTWYHYEVFDLTALRSFSTG
jgi:hypothetical protein